MPPSSTNLTSGDMILTLENGAKSVPGFVKADTPVESESQFAKVIASSMIKFTDEGQSLCETDSPQSFIALSELLSDLTDQAQKFLNEEVPFVYEDQPVQPLLLNFALFRLRQVSRQYYFASLQNQTDDVLSNLKHTIHLRQAEYENLLGTI